jgi:YD repeat-containing protein
LRYLVPLVAILLIATLACAKDLPRNWAAEYDDGVLSDRFGHYVSGDLDGDEADGDHVSALHGVDLRNELVDIDHDAEIDGVPSSSLEATVYDVNGNLVADGSFYYQYDAWNRLLRVSEVGDLEFNADGSIDDDEPGAWIVEFVYDALGRLIVTRHNWGDESGDFRSTEYLYDGARRIAETIRDPIEDAGTPRAITFTYAVQYFDGTQKWSLTTPAARGPSPRAVADWDSVAQTSSPPTGWRR